MSPWPPTKCSACGTETVALAQVSDPFRDSCYGVCAECLGYLHGRLNDQLTAALADAQWHGNARSDNALSRAADEEDADNG